MTVGAGGSCTGTIIRADAGQGRACCAAVTPCDRATNGGVLLALSEALAGGNPDSLRSSSAQVVPSSATVGPETGSRSRHEWRSENGRGRGDAPGNDDDQSGRPVVYF